MGEPACREKDALARVTVEDCTAVVENRFELVLLAAERARAISRGSDPVVEQDNDKNPVVALREIAEEKVVLDFLREGIVRSLQHHHESDDVEDEDPVEMYAKSLGLDGVPPAPEEELAVAEVESASDSSVQIAEAADLAEASTDVGSGDVGEQAVTAPGEAEKATDGGFVESGVDPITDEAGEDGGEENFG